MYKFIVNPDTGRRVGVNTKKGKQIILNYMVMLGGSNDTNKDLVNFNILVNDALDLLEKKIDGGFMGYHEAMLDEWDQFYQQAKNNTSIDSDVVKNKAHELFDDIDSHLAATGSSLKVTRIIEDNNIEENIQEDIVYFDTLVTDALDLLERKAVGTNAMAWYDPIKSDWEQSYEEAQNNTNIDALKEKANELFDIIDNLLKESGSSLKVKRTL